MASYFTADLHLGHKNVIQHSSRPFATVDEMDARLIENWNRVVTRDTDDVYVIGDLVFLAKKPVEHYVRQLRGRIHLILGNHDDDFAELFPELFASVQDVKYIRLNGRKIFMSHYAHRVWRASNHGSWHLYGHSHGLLPNYRRSMDVGVDVHNFTPLSFEEIRVYMETQPETHHHPEGAPRERSYSLSLEVT